MKRKRGLLRKKSLVELTDFFIQEGISMRDAREFLLKKKKRRFNKRGQAGFVFFIITILALIVLIFASPILFAAVNIGASQTGTATAFFIRLFPWVIIIVAIAVGYRLVFGGGG